MQKELASLADIYCNDAFGTAHRAHASTAGVAAYLPAVCGYLIQKEISIMGKGPSKTPASLCCHSRRRQGFDKIGVITNLFDKVDTLIIGGAMAYTFKKAAGESIGTSLCEEDKLELADNIVKTAKKRA